MLEDSTQISSSLCAAFVCIAIEYPLIYSRMMNNHNSVLELDGRIWNGLPRHCSLDRTFKTFRTPK